VVYAARLIAGLSCLAVLALPSAAGAGTGAQPAHYASELEGTDAFIGIAKTGKCFKAYLSDGTGAVATLSVWLQGCLQPDGRRLSAERGGVRIDAEVDRRRASGTITLRDGRSLPFSARSGHGGGIVGRRFTFEGRRYRSGWVVLDDNQVRWAITPIGRGLYGAPPPPLAAAPDPCAAGRTERDLLRQQRGQLLHQSGVWELRLNLGRGPTGAAYNRLGQAISALDERIFALDQQLYECA
jgi:hypothetical protein